MVSGEPHMGLALLYQDMTSRPVDRQSAYTYPPGFITNITSSNLLLIVQFTEKLFYSLLALPDGAFREDWTSSAMSMVLSALSAAPRNAPPKQRAYMWNLCLFQLEILAQHLLTLPRRNSLLHCFNRPGRPNQTQVWQVH
jgi:hypothetical protein